MDPAVRTAHAKLMKVRERTDLTIRSTPFLKDTIYNLAGEPIPFRLRYYQIQMVIHLMIMDRFVVGDDTGLGKTLESIAALCYLWEKQPDTKALVLTKKSAVKQWANEGFGKFTNGVNVFVSKGPPKQRAKIRAAFEAATGPTVIIMGYRSAVQDFRHIQNWKGYVFIGDEATVFKNPRTQVHQVCKHLGQQASKAWGLSATIIKNRLDEGYGIYKVIIPNLFPMAPTAFIKNYCITRLQRVAGNRQIPVIVGYRQSDIERFRLKIEPYFLGRPKHAVASELPPLTIRTVKVGMTRFQHSKYQEALTGLLEIGTGEEKEVSKLTSIIYCQEIVNHPCLIDYEDETSEKLDALTDLLTEGGDFFDEKVIIFTRFRKMVDFAVPHLEAKGIRCVRVTGAEDEDQRQDAMESFQDLTSDTRVIFITMAGGDAINLQAAKALVFFDTPWSAGDYLQILGRMIRIGSIHDRVYALHLVTKASIDERVMEVMKKKMKLVEAIIGKRIKGESDPDMSVDGLGEDAEFEVTSEITELFDALREDALATVRS
ncbi:DEAD/DEAH box helicase [Deltaproteobacteria bacterium]|nr:DEAD/DEAH box helicase [Deltaproteobacteria bacterium]